MNFALMRERLALIKARLKEVGLVFVEIYKGFARRDEMLFRALVVSALLGLFITIEWDAWFFQRFGLWRIYPADGWIYRFYVPLLVWLPILLFGLLVRVRKREFASNLKEVFDLVGLKNALGSYPKFLSLEPLTGGTMKLRVTNGAFTLDEWRKRRERLEANMRVFIDEIRCVQEKGIIEITFSFDPMPAKVSIENIFGYRDYKFLLGRDRTKAHIGNFAESPHLLVGGETGGGKSAFLRQIITTIKLNQPEAEFHIVDLKGGVDFGYMEKYPGIGVISEVSKFAADLLTIKGMILERSEALKKLGLTKIEDFFASDEFRRMDMEARARHVLGRRVFVVVDECAEIFLVGLGHNPTHTREIRAAMSQITRLGRFVGIHAILGTQRPDKNAVDPQVKTNLTTTVCYRIHDHGGSLAVLGTGRATDLPKLPGRAILATGAEEIEIQTPFLELRDSIGLLDEKFKDSLDEKKGKEEVRNGEKDPAQETPQPNPFK
jgi:FtsK/SpoIIIE family